MIVAFEGLHDDTLVKYLGSKKVWQVKMQLQFNLMSIVFNVHQWMHTVTQRMTLTQYSGKPKACLQHW